MNGTALHCAVVITSILTLASLPEQDFAGKTYVLVYPSAPRITLNENHLLLVLAVQHDSISAVRFYIPWTSHYTPDLSTRQSRMVANEAIVKSLPADLVLGRVMMSASEYHQQIESIADSFTIGEHIVAKDFFTKDTSVEVVRMLRERDLSIASLTITGWLPLTVRLNGERDDYCRGRYVAVPIVLQPQKNVIRFELLASSGALLGVDSVVAFYSLDIDGEPPSQDAPSETFHTSEREAPCVACHVEASGSSSPSTPRLKCESCHGSFAKQRSVHGPVASKDCKKCHNLDPDKSGYTLTYQPKDENQACFACHNDVLDKTKGKLVVHGPFGGGRCNYCHSPHGSQNIYQLRKPVNELCNSCHEDKHENNHPVVFHPVGWKPDPRNPDRELSCISCHDPHASDNKSLLVSSGGYFALCQSCHNK